MYVARFRRSSCLRNLQTEILSPEKYNKVWLFNREMKEKQILLLLEKSQELNRNTRGGDEIKRRRRCTKSFFFFLRALNVPFTAPINLI